MSTQLAVEAARSVLPPQVEELDNPGGVLTVDDCPVDILLLQLSLVSANDKVVAKNL